MTMARRKEEGNKKNCKLMLARYHFQIYLYWLLFVSEPNLLVLIIASYFMCTLQYTLSYWQSHTSSDKLLQYEIVILYTLILLLPRHYFYFFMIFTDTICSFIYLLYLEVTKFCKISEAEKVMFLTNTHFLLFSGYVYRA